MKRFTRTDAIALFVLCVAAIARFHDITLRPFHHDEGVNGFFLTRLVREWAFTYDPSNYHGPSLYYFSLPLVWILGLSDEAVRGTTALFGVATLALLWMWFRSRSAAWGLGALLLLGFSPGAIFFSRYFIHETLFVFFTLLIVAAAPSAESRARWRFVTAGLGLGLLFATKETAFVSVLAFSGGAVMAAWLVHGTSPLTVARGILPWVREHSENLMAAWTAFVASAGLLYSSFFTNPRGLIDAFRTYAFWTKTAVRDHDNPVLQHLFWMWEADPVLVGVGATGVVLALILRRSFIGVMAAVWTLLIFVAYAIPNYKTPWLGLNVLLPLALSGGYLIHEIASVTVGERRLFAPLAATIALAAAGFSGAMSTKLETRDYDREEHAYLYAHTQRKFIEFVRLIESHAAALGTGKSTSIAVFAPENWPLPWYLRNYPGAGYWGEFKSEVSADLYVTTPAQDPQMAIKLEGKYDRFGDYNMRGTVDLVLYVRRIER